MIRQMKWVCSTCTRATLRRARGKMLLLCAAAALFAPLRAAAQDPLPLLEMGARLRLEPVSGPSRPTVGRATLSTPDSLGIVFRDDMLFLSRPELRRVQLSEGRSAGQGALKGAGWGALVVGGLVVLGVVADSKAPDESQFIGATGAAVLSGVVIIPVTTLLGAFIGSERWTTVWESR